VAFHPSWCYFFERYGIKVGAYVEPFPGKEPTPQTIQQLKQDLKGAKRCIVLSEIQLPAKSAEVLAETLEARIAVIDPLGGQGDRTTYAGLLRYNALRVREALQ
jgi:ABC-type Zn uptake system ZnuABC Zn-binding protein ZnuA